MKEFTLNADFGMTASDDSFSLYGIHTGDTIMFKKVKDFPADGSLVAVILDDGPIALKRISYAHELELLYLESDLHWPRRFAPAEGVGYGRQRDPQLGPG